MKVSKIKSYIMKIIFYLKSQPLEYFIFCLNYFCIPKRNLLLLSNLFIIFNSIDNLFTYSFS